MATKEQVIPVAAPPLMQLTTDESEALRERFKADLADVVPAKTESLNMSMVTNVERPPRKPRKARKPGKKKGATKKKGARKTTKKKATKKTSKKK